MRKDQEQKINEILVMMSEKKSIQAIAAEKFSKNLKRCVEYLEKNKSHFKHFPEYFGHNPIQAARDIKKNQNGELIDLSKYTMESLNENDLQKLPAEELGKLLIMYAPKLLNMLKNSEHVEKINNFINEKNNLLRLDDVLVMPKEITEAADKRNRTLRLSAKIEKEFDELIKDFSIYSKTDLLNLAVKEFTEKYKKR